MFSLRSPLCGADSKGFRRTYERGLYGTLIVPPRADHVTYPPFKLGKRAQVAGEGKAPASGSWDTGERKHYFGGEEAGGGGQHPHEKGKPFRRVCRLHYFSSLLSSLELSDAKVYEP